MSPALSMVFRPKCHLEFVQAASGCVLSPYQLKLFLPIIVANPLTTSAVEGLTVLLVCLCNKIDTDGPATSRRSQGGGPACSGCSPSSSAERGRRGLRRRARLLRCSRPCAGQVRDAAPPPRRGAPGQPGGRNLRRQPTGVLCRRSGVPGERHSRTVAATARTPAQPQVYRGSSRLRRALVRRARCSRARNPSGGGPTPFRNYSSSPFSRTSCGPAQKKTGDQTPIDLTSHLADGRYLLEQYEALRREALREDWRARGHGMALFMTRGMTAWVATVIALAPAAVPKPQQCAAEEAPQSHRPVVAFSFRAELTAVLAGMVLACCEGKKEAGG